MSYTQVDISAASLKHVVSSCAAQPAWAEIWLHAAATLLLCHKQLPVLSAFPHIPPLTLVTIFRENKIPIPNVLLKSHLCYNCQCFWLLLPVSSSLPLWRKLTIILWTAVILSPCIHDFCLSFPRTLFLIGRTGFLACHHCITTTGSNAEEVS